MLRINKCIKSIILVLGLGCIVAASSCKRDIDSEWIESDQKSISQWLETREDLTLLTEALKTTGLYNRLGARASLTVFAPNNEAMEALFETDESLRNDSEKLKEIISYHLLSKRYDSEDFVEGGFLRDTTILGPWMTVDINNGDFFVNGRAQLLETDIDLTNGYLHVVNEVIIVPDKSLYEALSQDGAFSLFKSGIDQNPELKAYLSTVDVDSIAPATIIAIPNDVFASAGVSELSSLKALAVETWKMIGDTLDEETALKRYMEYHVLPAGSANDDGYVFLVEMANTVYSSNSNKLDFLLANYSNQGIAYINTNPNDPAATEITLDNERSNFLHANGVMHVATKVLGIVTPEILVDWGISVDNVKEFEEGFYNEYDRETAERSIGFYENAGVKFSGLELIGSWYSSSLNEGGPQFVNTSNTPGWFEATLENIVPGTTYEFYYKGQGYNYSYVFVYLYPVEETDEFEADPYLYKLKDGANEVSIHAERGVFEYPGNPGNYVFRKQLNSSTYKIRFEVRGKNNFLPGKLTLKQTGF